MAAPPTGAPALIRRLALALLLLLVLGSAGAVAWLALRDPLAALPAPERAPVLLAQRDELRGDRLLSFVRLGTATLGEVAIVIDRPARRGPRKLPLIVVLGGLGSGERNISWIKDIGENAVIGYDWPVPTAMPRGLDLVRAAPDLYARALSIPGQVGTALAWVARQDWADRERVSLLGFSLGALAAPAIQRVAPVAPGWTVLAYGGAPLGELVAANPHLRPPWIRPLLRAATNLLLRPVEPALHLPHLQGRFLVLEGKTDEFVPAAASARLRELTPAPKRVVAFEGGHMGVGSAQLELLGRIIAESRAWLTAERAVNPP